MAIPEAVRRQGERADQLLEQAKQSMPPGQGAGDAKTPPGATPPAPASAPPAPPAPPAEKDWKAEYEALRHKHQVLQGKYNAEVPRAAEHLKQVRQENEELKERNRQLQQDLETAKQQAAPPAAPPSSFNYEKAVYDYGEDMANTLRDVFGANEALRSELAAAKTQIQKLQGEVGKVSESVSSVADREAQDAERRFFAALDDPANGIQDWRVINKDPEFIDWLQVEDPMTGRTRQELLSQARAELRTQSVIAIFKAFIESKGAGAPPAPSPEPHPGGGGGPPSEGGSWTTSKIKQFYNDVSRGKYQGKETEAARIEKEILAAQQAGKVIRD